MSIKSELNTWARGYILRVYSESKFDIPEGTDFIIEEEAPSPYYCETCGPDPYYTNLKWTDSTGGKRRIRYYGTLGEIIQEILNSEED